MENRGRSAAQYRARKKASIALCKDWLEKQKQNSEWKEMIYRKGVKADDSADSLNQALAYCGVIARDPVTNPEPLAVVIRARKPTTKQSSRGNFSKSNLKHIFTKEWADAAKDVAEITKRIRGDKKIERSVFRHYANIESCVADLT